MHQSAITIAAIAAMFALQCTAQSDSSNEDALAVALAGTGSTTLSNLSSQGSCNTAEGGVNDTSAWSVQWGTAQGDFAQQVAVDHQGSIYVAGFTDGNLDGNTNTGAYDVFITKYDQPGNKLWTRLVGGTAQDLAYSIATDSRCNVITNGYTYGSFDGNTQGSFGQNQIIAKYDTNGNKLWTAQSTVASGTWASVAVDAHDDIYITGMRRSGSVDEVALVKYDSSGNQTWVQYIPYGYGQVVTVDNSDNVYVAGTAFNGFDGLTTTSSTDLFIAKYDSAGNKLWSQLSSATDPEFAYAMTTDTSGNVYMGGHMRLFKYTSSGTQQWAQSMQSPGGTPGATDDIRSLKFDSTGKLHVVGYTSGQFTGATSLGAWDIFLAEINPATGAQTAIRQLGSNAWDEGWGLAFDSNDNLLLCGRKIVNNGDALLYRNP